MTEVNWQHRLQSNMRETARFWSAEGEALECDNGHSPADARLITLGFSIGAAGIAAAVGASAVGDLAGDAQSVISMAGWYCGALAWGATAALAWQSPGAGDDRPKADATQLQDRTQALFESLDSDPRGRQELVALMQSDEGRQMCMGLMETQAERGASSRLLQVSRGSERALNPEDDASSPEQGPSQ